MEEKDYKKLYEDVLERAKSGLKDKNYYLSQSAKEVTEFLFPQLKETEDEKVKRELTRFLINFNNGYYSRPSETEIDSWIKWIDKKCGQKPTDKIKSKFKIGDWIADGEYIWKVTDIKPLDYILQSQAGSVVSDDISYVDKHFHLWAIEDAKDGDVLAIEWNQDNDIWEKILIFKALNDNGVEGYGNTFKNKDLFFTDEEVPYYSKTWSKCLCPATKEQRNILFQKMKEAGYEWDAEKKELNKIEKQGEQNPTDNVEPKFKVGDWIINNDKRIAFPTQILKIEEYGYVTSCGYTSFDKVKTDYHLWTIQDANDGDVLATKKGNPFIYDKDRYNNGLAYYYAGLDVNKELTLKSPQHMLAHFGELCSIFPATKEQRDLLFQNMKEAGYEWDAENKKLKKIEQKSAWSEEYEGQLQNAIDALEFLGKRKEYHSQSGYDAALSAANWLKSLKDRVQPQPKQEWSKEDKKMIEACLLFVNANRTHPLATKCIDWLESIKDRALPQSKQEWSEEDKERLARIHQFIWANRKGDTDEIYQQEQDADWLMSIIPQSNQYDKGYNDGYSAAKYNQWKPTDKQMEDFQMLLDYNIGDFDYDKFMSVMSLYDDLKKNLID